MNLNRVHIFENQLKMVKDVRFFTRDALRQYGWRCLSACLVTTTIDGEDEIDDGSLAQSYV